MGAYSTDKALVHLVLSGGEFCFDDGTLSVISKISDVIEKNGSKKHLCQQVLGPLKRGNWKYKVGGIPKMSEAIAKGAWRSDDGWCHLVQAMESYMEGDLNQTNELVTKFLQRWQVREGLISAEMST